MDATQVSRNADVWIEESKRPYNISINELTEPGALRKFSMNHLEIEEGIAKLLLATDCMSPDAMLASVSIFFILMIRRFQLRLSSVLMFAENYLSSGEKKPASWALRQTLSDDFENYVTRYDTVKLGRAVNVTEVLNRPKGITPG